MATWSNSDALIACLETNRSTSATFPKRVWSLAYWLRGKVGVLSWWNQCWGRKNAALCKGCLQPAIHSAHKARSRLTGE